MTSTCRLCLNDQHQVYSIFENDQEELARKIKKCTSVEICKEDGLPSTACMNCIQAVIQFDLFRTQCRYSDSVIRKKYFKAASILTYGVEEEQLLHGGSSNSKVFKEHEENSNDFTDPNVETKATKTDDLALNTSDEEDDYNNFDLDYDPQSDSDDYIVSENTDNVKRGKKKCKIKDGVKAYRRRSRHHLVYSDQDYAILGRERKVRIYEMDDTIRKIIGNNVYICEICEGKFQSFFEYYDHQQVHNGELVFKCDKCSAIFCSRKSLEEHDARHKMPCKICNLEILPKSMPAHLLIHTDVHKCPDCSARHSSKASLETHIKARHTGVKGFVCHVCGKQSSCQSSMNRHIAYHSSERPYKCKYCDFCAKSLNIVQVHASRKHFAEKCVCEICAKLFKSQPSLVQHMKRIHTDRKYVCNICGKTFIEKYNLNRHLQKHAGQRLHECKLCKKEFFTVRKLKEHMHTHRQGCVNCPKCGKEFFYKKYYSKHILKCMQTDKFSNSSTVVDGSNCIPVISHYK